MVHRGVDLLTVSRNRIVNHGHRLADFFPEMPASGKAENRSGEPVFPGVFCFLRGFFHHTQIFLDPKPGALEGVFHRILKIPAFLVFHCDQLLILPFEVCRMVLGQVISQGRHDFLTGCFGSWKRLKNLIMPGFQQPSPFLYLF